MTQKTNGPTPAPASQSVLNSLTALLEKQRALLRIADHVRPHELDDEAEIVKRHVVSRYPGFDEELVDAVTTFFLTSITQMEDASNPEEEVKESLDEFIRVAGEKINDIGLLVSILNDANERPRHLPSASVLFGSLLTALVGDFEVFLAELARTYFREYPQSLARSEKTFTFTEIVDAGSVENIREQAIDARISALARDSISNFVEFVSTNPRCKLASQGLMMTDDVAEIFLRRNIVVHNDGRVSKTYLDNLPKGTDRPSINFKLASDVEYFRRSADLLIGLAYQLAHRAESVYRTEDDDPMISSSFANFGYRLLQDRRFLGTEITCNASSRALAASEQRRLIMTVNYWLALKRQGKFDECKSEVREFEVGHLDAQFRLAKHALLDELDRALAVVDQLRGTEQLSLTFWATWPLLEELRRYERELRGDKTRARPIESSDTHSETES